jgi:YggT family protein
MFATIFMIIVSAVYWLLMPAALLRFYMQLLSLSFRNPIGQFVRALTDWIILPLRKIFKGTGYDWASLIAAYLFEILYILMGAVAHGTIVAYATPVGLTRLLVGAVFGMAATIVAVMLVIVLIYAILSWVGQARNDISGLLAAMVEPWLRPIRRFVPLVGGFDLSPLVLCVLLQIANVVLNYTQAAVTALIR